MNFAFWDEKVARSLFTALTFVAVFAFLHGAQQTLTLFLFAILFAYLVDPVVRLLEKLLRGRIRAIVAFYVLFLGAMSVLGIYLGPVVVDEGRSLLTSLPGVVDRLASGQFIITWGHDQGWDQARQVQIQHFFMTHRNDIFSYGEAIAEKLRAPLFHIWWLILIPILAVFFLKDASGMARTLVDMGTKRPEKRTIRSIISDVHSMLGSYIRAQMILAVLTAVAYLLVLGLMHAPYSFILSPIAGACEFIPVVGPAVACLAIFLIAVFAGYNHLLWLFLFLGAWRIVQDYFNAPKIMGKSVEVSPLAEIFAVLAGGEIGGVVGALVAVPLLATLKIVWSHLGSTQDNDEPEPKDVAFRKPALRP